MTPPPPAEHRSRRLALRRFLSNPAFEFTVALLIMASAVILLLEVWEPGDPLWSSLGVGISLIFAVEMALRFVAEQRKSRFFTGYWFDLVALAPLLLPDYGALRAFRLLRLFRLGSIMAQSNRRLSQILRQTAGEQLSILAIIGVIVVVFTLALVSVEPSIGSIEDAFWGALFSLVAGEPIGLEPVSTLGKMLLLAIMLGGLTVFALLTGTVSAVMADRLRRGWSTKRMALDELEGHLIICGWNRSGRVLLAEFSAGNRRKQAIVIVAETRPDLPAEVDDSPDIYFHQGDYTKVEVLEAAGARRAATAILLADRSRQDRTDQDRDARTVLAGLTIEKLNPRIFTCAELLSRDNETHLRMAGIEEVVIGDEYSGTILATSSRVGGVIEIADEIFSARYGNQIYKRAVRPEWVGRTVLEVQQEVKRQHEALLLAIEKGIVDEGGDSPYSRTVTNPPANYKLQAGDRLIVLAHDAPNW